MQRDAYRAWFAGLTFSAVAGLYTLWQLGQREQKLDKKEGEGVVESKKIERYAGTKQNSKPELIGGDRERTSANIQLVSDLCDLTIPGTALGYVNLDDGIVGLAGTLSSLIGVWSIWKKTA